MDNKTKYENLLKAYKDAYPDLKKETQFKETQKMWNSIKSEPELYQKKMSELKAKAAQIKASKIAMWNKFSFSAATRPQAQAPKGRD